MMPRLVIRDFAPSAVSAFRRASQDGADPGTATETAAGHGSFDSGHLPANEESDLVRTLNEYTVLDPRVYPTWAEEVRTELPYLETARRVSIPDLRPLRTRPTLAPLFTVLRVKLDDQRIILGVSAELASQCAHKD